MRWEWEGKDKGHDCGTVTANAGALDKGPIWWVKQFNLMGIEVREGVTDIPSLRSTLVTGLILGTET